MSTPSSMRPKLLSPTLPAVLAVRAAAALGHAKPLIDAFLRRMILAPPPALATYVPTEHDVFVATFAKSGTNWAMQICLQIVHRGAAEFSHIHQLVPWPEAPTPGLPSLEDDALWRRSPTGLRVIKTHLAVGAVPYHPSAKYVTIIRDPKEVTVSAYYFLLGLLGIRHRVTPSQWVDMSVEPGFSSSAWAQHTASWWALRERPNVVVRTYNQLKADMPGAIEDIARLLSVTLTEPELARVVERSSLPYMKAHESQFSPLLLPLPRADQQPKMVRRGAVGRSDEMLDASQRARIDDNARAQLLRFGSDFPYDELFG